MAAFLVVEQGDISGFDGDAIVNAANNHLVLGVGVAGAIAARGGPEIQQQCDAYVAEHGPIRVGESAITGAGHLSVRYVIHAAAMGDEPVSERSIREATRHSMELARQHSCASLAFPVLGSGVGGFPFEQAAILMIEEIRSLMRHTDVIEQVVLFGHTPEQAAILRRLVLSERG